MHSFSYQKTFRVRYSVLKLMKPKLSNLLSPDFSDNCTLVFLLCGKKRKTKKG